MRRGVSETTEGRAVKKRRERMINVKGKRYDVRGREERKGRDGR